MIGNNQDWVFPIQNLFLPSKMGLTGINLFFPVFPIQNWEKLSKTGKSYISSSKTFLICDYQTKIEQDELEDNLTKKVMSS